MNSIMRPMALVLSLLVLCPSAHSQQDISSAPPLSDLRSPDWGKRADAYEQIRADQEALKRADVKKALLDLLDLENKVIHMTFVTPKGRVGVIEKYGEGYTEYYYDLEDTVSKTADWHDPHQLCVLAEGSYNPDSQLGVRLAVEGGAAAVPCLLKMAQSNYDSGVSVLLQLSAVTKDLAPAVREQIRQATLAALRNPDERFIVVEAVGKFGGLDMIPVLQDIALNDPYSRLMDNGQRRFDVREVAARAMQSIQERSKAK